MADPTDEARIDRIRQLLEDMRAQRAETREEALVATEQLLAQVRARHEEVARSHRETQRWIRARREQTRGKKV